MQLIFNDCLVAMRDMADNSVDSIVTDPPYGLSFLGKKWDYDVPSVEIWQECLRVLKPGGFLLSFAGTRTQHRMAVNIEDAGFEIRDMIAWVYGSGFPKGHNIGKAVDKKLGNEREVVGTRKLRGKARKMKGGFFLAHEEREETDEIQLSKGSSPWEGWGTALKPALEPITVARKPFKGTVAENVLKHGTGGINVDGCRVGTKKMVNAPAGKKAGRFPANLIHDGSDEVVEIMGDKQRFFYCAKASKKDRGEGNRHPTVKPTKLMRYLCRLVTQPGGVILDPFMGSGSTGKAAKLEGLDFIGIEMDEGYIKIAEARIQNVQRDDSDE